MAGSIAIITPTYHRDPEILQRCFQSIESQTYTNWTHYVVVDDVDVNDHISPSFQNKYKKNRKFLAMGKHTNNYGNTPRQYALSQVKEDFVVFIDDDNLVFPHYLEYLISRIGDCGMCVCKIIHMGPLPHHLGDPPRVITGNPPIVQNIDTLQVMFPREVIQKYGWLDAGYTADGSTYQNIASHVRTTFIDDVLGIHF